MHLGTLANRDSNEKAHDVFYYVWITIGYVVGVGAVVVYTHFIFSIHWRGYREARAQAQKPAQDAV